MRPFEYLVFIVQKYLPNAIDLKCNKITILILKRKKFTKCNEFLRIFEIISVFLSDLFWYASKLWALQSFTELVIKAEKRGKEGEVFLHGRQQSSPD